MRIGLALVVALLLSAPSMGMEDPPTAEELAHQQERVEKHLLRVQQERFEARARGEDTKSLRRLEREFKRTYGRRNALIDEQRRRETESE